MDDYPRITLYWNKFTVKAEQQDQQGHKKTNDY